MNWKIAKLPFLVLTLTLPFLSACQRPEEANGPDSEGPAVSKSMGATAASIASNPATPPGFSRVGTIANWGTQNGGLAYIDWNNVQSLHALDNGVLYKVDESTGARTAMGSGRFWANVPSTGIPYGPAMTQLKGFLYIVANNYLYKVDRVTGAYTQLGGKWWDRANFITSLESNNRLYIMHSSSVYAVDPANGNFVKMTGAWWDKATSLSSSSIGPGSPDNQIMIIHNGGWYSFRAEVKDTPPCCPNYPIDYGRGMIAPMRWQAHDRVLAVANGDLIETSHVGNQGTVISQGYWRLAQAMTTGYYSLYIISDGALFKKTY